MIFFVLFKVVQKKILRGDPTNFFDGQKKKLWLKHFFWEGSTIFVGVGEVKKNLSFFGG